MHTSLVRAARAAPERLLAFYSDHNVVDLGDKHRFPMAKYLATRMALANDASLVDKIELLEAPAADLEDVCAVHDPAYVQVVIGVHGYPHALCLPAAWVTRMHSACRRHQRIHGCRRSQRGS